MATSFQGSETSSAEVVIYHRGGDQVLLSSAGDTEFRGRRLGDQVPCLLSVSVQTNVSAPGIWQLRAKPTKGWEDLMDKVVDDDWVDIVFTRHNRRWHMIRGLVDDVRRLRVVGSGGATHEVVEVMGRSFAKVWLLTPVWFNRFTAENVAGVASYQLMTGPNTILSLSVDEAIDLILNGFLRQASGLGRANWLLPPQMPNLRGPTLVDNYGLRTDLAPGQVRQPARVAASANFLVPDGDCWQLARSWCDPMFCELFADQLPLEAGDQVDGAELLEADSQMTVVLRDKPFPRLDAGRESPWFALPLYLVPRQQLVDFQVGRGGMERYNAFFVSPMILQGTAGSGSIDLNAPLWDSADIQDHGLRRYDVTSSYVSLDPEAAEVLRQRSRDWNCLNPYLFNGTFRTGVGRPDMRVGSRLRVPGVYGEDDQETYYIESLQQSWQFGVGLRTAGTITRGWRGTDESLLRALEKQASRYDTGAEAQAGVDYSGTGQVVA